MNIHLYKYKSKYKHGEMNGSMCFPLITLRDDAGIHEGGECEVGEHKECDDALTCWHPGVVVDVVLGTKTRMM